MDIKAIVFDLGGVLFQEGRANAVTYLANTYQYDKSVVMDILICPQSKDLHRGLVGDDEFWTWVQSQVPQGYDALVIKQAWYDGYVLDENIFELLKQLHGRYTLIAFSGNIKSRVEYLDKKYNYRRLFDWEVYSYDHRANKGEKEFVEVLIKESGLHPREMVYIDDSLESVNRAQEFGITSLVYEAGNMQKLEHDLKNLGIE
jgi:FMN phosphatase YigB (HAD superfamily)